MTGTTTADLLQGVDPTVPAYGVHVTVVRYVRAGDASTASLIAVEGLELMFGEIGVPSAAVVCAAARRPDAVPYRHSGEEGLWRVSIDIDATVEASTDRTAAEAAHQIVTVIRGDADVFEPELEVFPVDRIR